MNYSWLTNYAVTESSDMRDELEVDQAGVFKALREQIEIGSWWNVPFGPIRCDLGGFLSPKWFRWCSRARTSKTAEIVKNLDLDEIRLSIIERWLFSGNDIRDNALTCNFNSMGLSKVRIWPILVSAITLDLCEISRKTLGNKSYILAIKWKQIILIFWVRNRKKPQILSEIVSEIFSHIFCEILPIFFLHIFSFPLEISQSNNI